MSSGVTTSGAFCVECEKPKGDRFCKNCRRETANLFKVEAYSVAKASASMEATVRRCDVSIGYFVATYGVVVTILSAAIAVLDIKGALKAAIIVIASALLFKAIFYSAKGRNFVIGLISKIKNYEERHR